MEIIGGFFYASNNKEDTMKKTHIDLVQITPDMDVEQILQKLTCHLLKQGWTITDDEAEEKESNNG